MAQAQKTTREDHGQQNALAWFSSIVEMVDALREAEKAEQDDVSDSYIDKVRVVEVRNAMLKAFR